VKSSRKKNNGKLNNGTRVRRTSKHGSQCEGKKHGINGRSNCQQHKIESYSQRVERSTEKANNGQLNNGTRVRRTRKHGSQCEGKKHG
jgi:hypothetical protein